MDKLNVHMRRVGTYSKDKRRRRRRRRRGEDEDEVYNAVRMSSGDAEIDKLKYEHPLVDRYASKEMRCKP